MLALFMNKLNIVRFPDYKVYDLSSVKFKELSYVYQIIVKKKNGYKIKELSSHSSVHSFSQLKQL